MAYLQRFSAEQIEELKAAKKKNKNKNVDKRLTALLMRAEGKSRKEVADRTGYKYTYLTRLVTKYLTGGLEAIVENHYPGNRRYMSYQEEEEFLERFCKEAESGQIVEVSKIKEAYDEAVGRKTADSMIYKLLNRHDWRRVMPRSKHPNKASDEVIEASKKLTKL